MKLSEYLLTQRKYKYSSAQEFIDETRLDIPLTNYYYYESGKIIPKTEDLNKIIKALDLNPKFVFTLWLHEHLPDETSKLYFPLPELDHTQRNVKMFAVNPDESTTLSKGHLDYLIEHRLARVLLSYFYINSYDRFSIDEIHGEFTKHKKKDIEKYLMRLIDFGYIAKDKDDKYYALSIFLYVPPKPEYRNYRKAMMLDMIQTSVIDEPLETKYGSYPYGMELYYQRTLSPEQLHYILSLMRNLYNEYRRMPNQAGQEFNFCIMAGAMYEK